MVRGTKKINNFNQQGSILVTVLLILVVINLMAVGLLQTAAKESKLATYEVLDSGVFHITNSCIHDSVRWLTQLTAPPTTVPYSITETSLSHMFTGTETTAMLSKLAGYSYTCTTTDLAVQSVTGQNVGVGEQIGESGGYGAAGDLSPRYFYQVVASGQGPQNSQQLITAVLSAEF